MLKQLLQQLLNTRTTPGGAAHSASSTYTSPQWFNGTSTAGDKWTNGLYTGTAPNDGYLNISGSAYITTENVGSMIQAQIGDGQISQVSPMSGQGFNMLFPISKGASFSVNGIRLTDITVRFFKAIGGGYNFFAWRALSCLRALSNFSQKVSSRAKGRGLAPKPSLRKNWFLSQLPMEALISLLTTAGSASGVRQLHEQSCTQPWLPPLMCKKERYAMRPSEKAKLLLSSSALKQHKPRPSLFLLLDQVNSFKGGAAC